MLKFIVFIFLSFSFPSLGQKDPCLSNDQKYIKMLSKAISEGSFEKQTKKFTILFKKYPNYAETYFKYAQLLIKESQFQEKNNKNYKLKNELLKNSLIFYQNTIEICPSYHAECYYSIAFSLYNDGDIKNSLPYFKEFIKFNDSDIKSIPKDFINKKAEVKALLEDIAFKKKLKSNPVPFSPVKLKNVSSKLDEYFPMISPDNDFLFFTRKVDNTNLGDIGTNIEEEFTISSLTENDEFTFGEAFPKPFNTGYFKNYGSATLALDNKEMIICACKLQKVYMKDYLNCDLYSTTYKRSGKGKNDFSWTPLINLGPNINTNDGWEAQPCLSADGKELFFTSSRKGSRDNDIYHSERQKDGSWSIAKPFDVINTDGKDKSPFFHQDGQTLYFVSSSSKQRKGLGGLDIFYIRKEGEKWSEPKNLGYPINSEQDELGIFLSTDGKTAYFSSFKEGDWNIYSFNLYEKARPKEVVLIKGELLDDNGNGISNASITLNYNESGMNKIFNVNSDDGKYVAVVDVSTQEDITITVNKEGFAYNSFVIQKEKFENASNTPIQMEKIKIDSLIIGKSYSLSDLFFETESFELNDKSLAFLVGFTNYLIQNPKISISINGHTDDIGDDNKNLVLSQKRADAVKDYLINKGVAVSRLKSIGYGESQAKYPNTDEINRAKNRRTEFEILEIDK